MNVPEPIAPGNEPPVSLAPALAPWAADAQRSLKYSFVFRLFFFVFFIPLLFAVAVWMRYYAIVATVLVSLVIANFFDQVNRMLERFPKVKDMGLLGKALSLTLSMRTFYMEHRPATFLFYVFYPVTVPVAMVFRPLARKEFKLWAKVLLALITADLINLALTYSSNFPPYLGITDALKFAGIHIVATIFLAVACLMPVSTTAFTFSLAGRGKSLKVLSVVSLVLSIGFTYLLMHQTAEIISPNSAQMVKARMNKKDFRVELAITSEIILTYMQIRVPPAMKKTTVGKTINVQPNATAIFRNMISHAAIHDEGKAFHVLGMRPTADSTDVWYAIQYIDDRKHYLLFLMDETAHIHGEWDALPKKARRRIREVYEEELPKGHVFVEKMAGDFPNE